jgi:hypothetical protein
MFNDSQYKNQQMASGQLCGAATQSIYDRRQGEYAAMTQANFDATRQANHATPQIKQPGLMEGLHGVQDLIDRLIAALNGLEDRLSPVLSGCIPADCGGQSTQQSPEPPAIDEIVRILLRLQNAVSSVENITHRVRV